MTTLIPTWVDGTLQPIEKLEAHRRGLRHKAISVFVLAGQDMLIQQRAAGKYHTPGLWANTCCSHPAWGESPADCVQRRLREELGLTGLAPAHRGQIEYRADVGGGLIEHEVVDLFVARLPARVPVTPNPDEVQAVDWVSPDALKHHVQAAPERFTPWLRIYMAQHAGQIFGSAAPA